MKLKGLVFRWLVFTHRWVGVVLGLLMLLWCMSGVVMMYVPFPKLDEAAVRQALPALSRASCCQQLPADRFDPLVSVTGLSVEMLGTRPVALIATDDGQRTLLDLTSGALLEHLGADNALQASRRHAAAHGIEPPFHPQVERIDTDQWTVYGSYHPDRPLEHVTLNDREGTQLYVSSSSGRIVLITTRMQRFWNWLGAVPHWLYFTELRRHAQLWNQVVIWSSLAGTFLTGFGLWLGIWQLRRRATGELASPYRGLKWWHHVPGLVFGVLVLTWVLSGLLSMTPWGFLESSGREEYAARLTGEAPSWSRLRDTLQRLDVDALPADTVRLELAISSGAPYLLAETRNGQQLRLNEDGQPASPTSLDIDQAVRALTQGAAGTSWRVINEADAFYYSHGGDTVTFPVVRVLQADGTRHYLEPLSLRLIQSFDASARAYRWLHYGLHRMDFPVLRWRPLWDVAMWLMLLGVTAVCATGAWMGMKRVLR